MGGSMLRFDFENSVGYWIFATAHEMSCALNEELQGHGITYRQWEVLAWLSYAGEMSQAELAERIGIEAPTVVGVIDRMERDGWIQRTASPSDRRKKIIRPTEKVEPLWNQMISCGMRVRARALAGLTPEELASLLGVLARIRSNLTGDPTRPSTVRHPRMSMLDGAESPFPPT